MLDMRVFHAGPDGKRERIVKYAIVVKPRPRKLSLLGSSESVVIRQPFPRDACAGNDGTAQAPLPVAGHDKLRLNLPRRRGKPACSASQCTVAGDKDKSAIRVARLVVEQCTRWRVKLVRAGPSSSTRQRVHLLTSDCPGAIQARRASDCLDPHGHCGKSKSLPFLVRIEASSAPASR